MLSSASVIFLKYRTSRKYTQINLCWLFWRMKILMSIGHQNDLFLFFTRLNIGNNWKLQQVYKSISFTSSEHFNLTTAKVKNRELLLAFYRVLMACAGRNLIHYFKLFVVERSFRMMKVHPTRDFCFNKPFSRMKTFLINWRIEGSPAIILNFYYFMRYHEVDGNIYK